MGLEKSRIKLTLTQEGQLIGFVSRNKKTGELYGVRENTTHYKTVCVLSDHLQNVGLEPDVLYEVLLKPMRNHGGFVIINARPILFRAQMEILIIPDQEYKISISFGNKTIYFDPVHGRTSTSKTIDGVAQEIKKRKDMLNKEHILKQFYEQANKLMKEYEQSELLS